MRYEPLEGPPGPRQPLVAQYAVRAPSRPWCSFACCVRYSLVCFFLWTFIGFVAMAASGMFRKINENAPEPRNGTVTEPNTGVVFPVYLKGPRGSTLDAIGVSLWVERIPLPLNPTVRVAAVCVYVEKNEGRRRLRAFKSRDPETDVEPKLASALEDAGMGEAFRYVVASTPPGDVMISGWIKTLKERMAKHCAADQIDGLSDSFKNVFTHSFKKGDDFTFERRPDESLYAFYQGTAPKLVTENPCLGRALVVSLSLRFVKFV